MATIDGKQERFERVCEAVLATLLRGGPDALSVSRLARRAGVSRAWIYKYVGADDEALLQAAARLVGDAFIDRDVSYATDDVAAWRGHISGATRKALDDTLRTPWLVELWFRYRFAPHALGAAIRDLETRHLDKFVAEMPRALRRDAARARRFAATFAAARLGAYHRWLDPAARGDADETVADLMGMLDGFIASR